MYRLSRPLHKAKDYCFMFGCIFLGMMATAPLIVGDHFSQFIVVNNSTVPISVSLTNSLGKRTAGANVEPNSRAELAPGDPLPSPLYVSVVEGKSRLVIDEKSIDIEDLRRGRGDLIFEYPHEFPPTPSHSRLRREVRAPKWLPRIGF